MTPLDSCELESPDFLIPTETYEALKALSQASADIFLDKSVKPSQQHFIVQQIKAQINAILTEFIDNSGLSRADVLSELYERLTADYLADFVDFLRNHPVWQRIFGAFASSDNEIISLDDLGEIPDKMALFLDLSKHVFRLKEVGFDKPSTSIQESPLREPFKEIDVSSPRWQRNLKIGANFVHAMNHLLDAHLLFGVLERVLEEKKVSDSLVKYMSSQIRALPAVTKILEGFREQVLDLDVRSSTNLMETLSDLLLLVSGRFLGEFIGRYEVDISTFPISATVRQPVSIAASSENQLDIALFEIVKNCLHSWKVDPEVLVAYAERGEDYAKIEVLGEVDLRGEKVAVIEIRDQGRPINLEAIRQKLGLGDYEYRDHTVGTLFNTILRRGISISDDPQSRDPHLGIGLDTAFQIIEAHHGTMIYSNMRAGGVGCLVLIPVKGKASGIKLSEEGITGAECDAMLSQLKGLSPPGDTTLEERLREYQASDRGTHTIMHEVNYVQQLIHGAALDCDSSTDPDITRFQAPPSAAASPAQFLPIE